jgi:hypothetical protein
MPKRVAKSAPTTPQAKLSSAIKLARDTMRKDAGLNGDLDRIPQLAWLLFLRAFDGLEERRQITDRRFRAAIEAPYRWRDWAADPVNGRTGQELLDFVNDELLPHLRDLRGTAADDPRDVIAAVFRETYNRMLSGYLLRDVVNKVNEINFASSDDIHTMAHLYESMLREMRDAAGDSGEFYTPRPVIRFMAQQVDPQLGDIVLDPACGTGGFLVEALEHMRPSVGNVQELRELDGNLRGIEKKPLPYLLGMMNLLLHEVQQPHIVRDNALARPLADIRNADRVDVVLTNPPFGGEEEKGIQAGFPEATRTAEPRGCSSSSFIASCGQVGVAELSSPTACCSPTASARVSRSACSRTATSTPSSDCLQVFSRRTRPSRRTSCSSRRPGARRRCGSTSYPRPRDARTTRRRSRCALRSSLTARNGGAARTARDAQKPRGRGGSRSLTSRPTTSTSICGTRTDRRISLTARLRNSSLS